METRVSYTIVGLFVLVLGATLGAIVLWLEFGAYGAEESCYYVYMKESVSGLNVDASVKYRGVTVGRVEDIKLRPDNPEEVWLTLAIANDAPIKTDTVATLSMQGLTGLTFVNLTGGSREAPPLRAQRGQTCPMINTKPSLLFRLDEGLSMILENFQHLTTDIRRLLNDQTRTKVKRILTDIAKLTDGLVAHQDTLEAGLVSAAHTLQMTERLSAKFPETMDSIQKSTQAIQKMAQNIADTSSSVNTIVKNSQQQIGRFTGQTLPEIGLLISQLRHLTTELQQIAQQIDREPNSLLVGRQGPRPGPGE